MKSNRIVAGLILFAVLIAGCHNPPPVTRPSNAFEERFKEVDRLVEGYRGTSLAMMAMERGEVEGVCQSLSQFRMVASHVQSGEVRFLLHVDENPVPELPDVASAFRYAKTEEQKQLLRFVFVSEKFVRSYVLPPNVPADRVETLRRAIADTVRDPDLLAEAKKVDVDMSYQPPEGFVVLLQRLYGASPELIDRVKKLVPNPG